MSVSPPNPEPSKHKANQALAQCPSCLVLEHVTSRWGVMVLATLLEGPHRFSELRRATGGATEKVLAQTLQTLERDGLVHRHAQPVIPPRVDYSLTGLGTEAAEQVTGLARWTKQRMDQVLAAQAAYDAPKDRPCAPHRPVPSGRLDR
ncbi:winged helix-turn-helix transcriptional regulator [Streptomyces sp. NPDC002537]